MERGRFRGLGAVPSRCLEHTRFVRRAGTFRSAGAREPSVPAAIVAAAREPSVPAAIVVAAAREPSVLAAIVGAPAFTQRPCFAQRRATEL